MSGKTRSRSVLKIRDGNPISRGEHCPDRRVLVAESLQLRLEESWDGREIRLYAMPRDYRTVYHLQQKYQNMGSKIDD
jgi:hypothetical protein